MEKENQIQYVAEFSILPGKIDAFKKVAQDAIEVVRAKTRLLGYRWYFNDDESKCYVVEQYPDSEAILPALDAVGQILPKLLDASKITRFEVFGNLSPEAAKVLAGFGAKNFRSWKGFVR